MFLFACLIAAAAAGCGGGNRMIVQRDGEVVRGELVLDSIPEPPEEDEYIICYGDELDIDFLFNTDYSRRGIKVRPDGKIAYPLVGEIMVAGLTISRLDELLTEKFSEIIVAPDITIIIKEFHERLVYVIGEARTTGGFPVEKVPTLLTALSRAGIRESAKRNSILVMRRTAPNHVVGIQVDLTELLDDHRFELDIPMRPYDIVYIPRSNVEKAEDFVTALYTIISRPMDIYLRGWRVWQAKTYYDYWSKQVGLQQ